MFLLGFPEGVFGFLKTFGKTNKTNKTKPISKGGSETFKNFVCVGFPEGFCWFSLVFFCTFGFPEGFCLLFENLRENQKTKRNPYLRVGLKPLKTCLLGFAEGFVGFLCFCFCVFGFPEGVFGFLKTFGETKKQNKTKPISKGGSETFKHFVLLVFPKVVVGFLWLFFVFLVFPNVFLVL